MAGAGNFTRHMQGTLNINQPLPDGPYDFNPIINAGTVFPYLYSPYQGYASISQSTNPLVEKWNALEVLVRHPMGHDFLVTSAYTWQHCLSDGRGVNFTVGIGVQDSYHPRGSYGTCITNAFNVWTSSLIWDLPWFRGSNGLAAHPTRRLAVFGHNHDSKRICYRPGFGHLESWFGDPP